MCIFCYLLLVGCLIDVLYECMFASRGDSLVSELDLEAAELVLCATVEN